MIVPGSANSLLLAQGAATGYNLTKSLRFRSSASAYLSRTPASATNRQTWTWSGWVKRGIIGGYQQLFGAGASGSVNSGIQLHNDANSYSIDFYVYNSGYSARLLSSQLMRDPASWYHIVAVYDSTQATSTNRMKLYINGVQVTAFSTATYPSQNTNSDVNNTVEHDLGQFGSGNYFDGYMTEVNFIDGQALTPSSFGENNADTGVWQPKRYTGTYGTNGFYLPFTNTTSTTTLGYDSSGNGNNWTTNNFSLTAGSTYDSMTDVPTLTSATTANYCVLNPLDKNSSVSTADGNLQFTNSNSSWLGLRGTMGMSSGKWYVEYSVISSTYATFGIANASASLTGNAVTGAWGYANDGAKSVNGTATGGWGSTFTTGDIIGMTFDADAGTLAFYKNNVSQGNLVTGLAAGTYFPWIASFNSNTVANFGQRPLNYTAPTNYVALNTYNLPTSTIVAGNKYMDATTYTGNGSTLSVTNAAGFKPDFVWIKRRDSGTESHKLNDSVRGVNKQLMSNSTDAEYTNTDQLTSFNSNGFTTGASATTNGNGTSLIAWQWQAGQGTNTTNTNGSITSTVSVNPTAGFSVVTFSSPASGAYTFGHGLGVTPSMVITKCRNQSNVWSVYHVSTGSTRLALNDTSTGTAGVWTTLPTSTTVWLPSSYSGSGDTWVAYCWAEIAGFSKFGSYTGNGSADGPFIYTGFRPKYVMYKCTSTAGQGWVVLDTSLNPYNLAVDRLIINTSAAEYTSVGYNNLDFLSNGFKVRSNSTDQNNNGDTYIYAAFAENPFKNALAR